MTTRLHACWVVAWVVVSCRSANPTTTPDPAPVVTPDAATSPVETIAPLGTSSAPITPPSTTIDPVKWTLGLGAKPPEAAESLGTGTVIKLAIGDALMCQRGAPSSTLSGGESVFSLRVIAVEAGQVVTLLDTPIAAGPLDYPRAPHYPGEFDYIGLDASVDATGALTVRERPGKTCADVLLKLADPTLEPQRRVVKRVCASRGTFVLHNGKLVRTP